jgi:predicted permease
MKQIFNVCDLVVMGYYLERTLRPIDKQLAPTRNIVYGIASPFMVVSKNEKTTQIKDSSENWFVLGNDLIDVLFEEI